MHKDPALHGVHKRPLQGRLVEAEDDDLNALLRLLDGFQEGRHLFYGPGRKEHQPELPVKFLKEDMKGHSPKFDAEDAAGKKWKGKMGAEAQPEPVAARLLWAIGYFANENYFVADLPVENLP